MYLHGSVVDLVDSGVVDVFDVVIEVVLFVLVVVVVDCSVMLVVVGLDCTFSVVVDVFIVVVVEIVVIGPMHDRFKNIYPFTTLIIRISCILNDKA